MAKQTWLISLLWEQDVEIKQVNSTLYSFYMKDAIVSGKLSFTERLLCHSAECCYHNTAVNVKSLIVHLTQPVNCT